MFKELFESTTEAYKERISSPLLGSFAFFWFAFNWRIPILIIKSDGDITDAFQYIDQNLSNPWDNYGFPALWAIGFVLVYPWVTYAYFRYDSLPDVKKRIEKLKADKKMVEASIELVEAEASLAEIRAKGEKTELDKERDREASEKRRIERIESNKDKVKRLVEERSQITTLLGQLPLPDEDGLSNSPESRRRSKLEKQLSGINSEIHNIELRIEKDNKRN